MKVFDQVVFKNSNKKRDYVITAEISKVAFDDREGPYFFIQEVDKGKSSKVNKANFLDGAWMHHSEVMVPSS